MLGHGEHVGQHLGRVPVVGETVEHRHPPVLRQLLDGLLAVAPVLDPVEHPAEYPGGVLHGLLVAHLRTRRVEVGGGRALVGGGHLERAAGARRGLLEDQRDVLPAQALNLGPGLLGRLELGGQGDQAEKLLGGEVQLLEEVTAGEVYGHDGCSWMGRDRRSARDRTGSLYDYPYPYTDPPPHSTGSRSTGQLMQRGPPRPRPSSLPRISITSMPCLSADACWSSRCARTPRRPRARPRARCSRRPTARARPRARPGWR